VTVKNVGKPKTETKYLTAKIAAGTNTGDVEITFSETLVLPVVNEKT
jgi:hypothetical protein